VSDSSSQPPVSTFEATAQGIRAGAGSIFSYVIFSVYIGFGALAHDLHFSMVWTVLSSPLIWAGPAQVILVTTLGTGSTLVQTALAVTLSAIRLLPMTASMLPLLKTERTRWYHLLIPAHFTAVAFWVEALRLLPTIPRDNRLAFANGFCLVLVVYGIIGTAGGWFLAGQLPPLLAAAVLFISPLSFLVSIAGNARMLIDRLALLFGIVLAPVLAMAKVELYLLVSSVIAGTAAYGIHRLTRKAP
jgi:predicted branched-subunit amino acid permease